MPRQGTRPVSFEINSKTKAVTLKPKTKIKTVKIVSRDSLEKRQCLEACHHGMVVTRTSYLCSFVTFNLSSAVSEVMKCLATWK